MVFGVFIATIDSDKRKNIFSVSDLSSERDSDVFTYFFVSGDRRYGIISSVVGVSHAVSTRLAAFSDVARCH